MGISGFKQEKVNEQQSLQTIQQNVLASNMKQLATLCSEIKALAAANQSVFDKLNELNEKRAEVEAIVKDHIKKNVKQKVYMEGIRVNYMEKNSLITDTKLLFEEMPNVKNEIPGLIEETVNKKVLETAIRSGQIPEDVLKKVQYKKPLSPAVGFSGEGYIQ
jgi:hypothetical protein